MSKIVKEICNTSLEKKNQSFAPAYITGIYPILVEKSRKYGYAICLHGSLQRDLDIIAIPWTEDAIEPKELVKIICSMFDVKTNHDINKPEIKPHGRLSWSIPLWWGAYIDLSIMPINKLNETK